MYLFGQWRSAVSQLYPLPTSCALPDKLRVVQEAEKPWNLCTSCSAVSKTSLHCQHCFQHKSETEPHSSSLSVKIRTTVYVAGDLEFLTEMFTYIYEEITCCEMLSLKHLLQKGNAPDSIQILFP